MDNTSKSIQKDTPESQTNIHTEQLNTSQSADQILNKDSSDDEMYVETLQDTPFRIVGNEKRGYFLAMGMYRLSETQDTPLKVKAWLKKNMWHVVGNMVVCMLETYKTLNEQAEKK